MSKPQVQPRGLLITFEGGEGVGKSTQVPLVAAKLREQGHTVVTTREPGGCIEAERVRELVLSKEHTWDPVSEVLLMYAARRQHLHALIVPSLAAGKIVLCDRFMDSTMAYQGYGHGVDQAFITHVQKAVVEDHVPDLTFIFDLPPEVGFNRIRAMGKNLDRMETVSLDFHQRLHKGMLAIAEKNKRRCVIIDASQDVATMTQLILQRIQRLIKRKRAAAIEQAVA